MSHIETPQTSLLLSPSYPPLSLSPHMYINPNFLITTNPSMDNKNNINTSPSSGDSFSFVTTPTTVESDFEFGSLTPDSPSGEPFATSPADHLFLNGRLQPHFFPLPTSRTSSTRDSLFSSLSNSTNSSCSSARTSSSDSSERKSFHNKLKGAAFMSKTPSHYQPYGCSQRWQFITPMPALNREGSLRRRTETNQVKDKGTMKKKNNKNKNKKKKKKKKKKSKKENKGLRLRFGRRILRWFVMACRECHAMEPSKRCNKDV